MKRIQRKRTKGWRMPENTKYVGRPTKWGNPFKVGDLLGDVPWRLARDAGANHIEKAASYRMCLRLTIDLYRVWVKDQLARGKLRLGELRGKDLACWCPLDRECHVDVLIELCEVAE